MRLSVSRVKKNVKITVLYSAKYSGLFFIARKFFRKGLRILCYHGFSDDDQVEWSSGLFITPSNFAKRMEYLKKKSYKLLPLDAALDSLSSNNLPDSSVVITIDDGFYGIKKYAHPIFRKYRFPYTIYVTSYYSIKESPIYNLAIPYLLWKAEKKGININDIHLPVRTISTKNRKVSEVSAELIEYGHSNLDNDQRVDLLKQLCGSLKIDYTITLGNKSLSLLSAEELKELKEQGVDIQLHTHRHVWPLNEAKAQEEIESNRVYIESITKKRVQHLCYPSGIYSTSQFPYLAKLNIKSATTCDFGLNYKGTHPYQLYRFLDSSEIPQIVFEAEMSGFLEALRFLRTVLTFKPGSIRQRRPLRDD